MFDLNLNKTRVFFLRRLLICLLVGGIVGTIVFLRSEEQTVEQKILRLYITDPRIFQRNVSGFVDTFEVVLHHHSDFDFISNQENFVHNVRRLHTDSEALGVSVYGYTRDEIDYKWRKVNEVLDMIMANNPDSKGIRIITEPTISTKQTLFNKISVSYAYGCMLAFILFLISLWISPLAESENHWKL